MLQQVILQTANPMTLEIGAADPDEILLLTSISGLSAADVTLFMGDYSRSGGYYQGRRVGQRNPVFNFKINPDYKNNIDASDARDILYRQFLEPMSESDGVQVLLKDDRRPDRYFIGYTDKLPSDIFVQRPSAQVSMICVDPFIKSAVETEGADAGWITVPLAYDGSADTGIELTIKITSTTTRVQVENNGLFMALYNAAGFLANDIIYINTKPGARAIQHNGVDVMAMLQDGSKWLSLAQVSNDLSIYGDTPADGKAVITNYKYRSEWWGV